MIKKIYSEGKKDSKGNITLAPGWGYIDSDEIESEELTSYFDEVEGYKDKSFDLRMAKASVNWIANGPVKEWMNKNGYDPETNSPGTFFDVDKLRDLIVYVEFTDLIDFTTAKTKIFPLLINNFSDETVWEMMEKLNVFDRADSSEVEKMVDDVLAKYPEKVNEYKTGKVGLLSMFMGEVMKLGKGKVKPQEVTELLKNKLGA